MKKQMDPQSNRNVEFGMEFGDVNAGKAFEISLMNQEKKKKINFKNKK